MPKRNKRKCDHCEDGTPSSPSTSSRDLGFDENSMNNRLNTDDEIDHDDGWETVFIPYAELPAGLFPVDDKSDLNPNSSTGISVTENSSMYDTAQTSNNQLKRIRNGMGDVILNSTIETHSNLPPRQKFSVFRSLDDGDGQSSTRSWEVLEHVFAHGPTAESSTHHQAGTLQNVTSSHQESPSTSETGRSRSKARPVPNRKVPKPKKSRSDISVKGLYSDVPLQNLVIEQFRIKQPHLDLSPRTIVQVETLVSDMVGRIADEAKNLVALSSKKRVDSRVLKYAIKLMLEHMKKEGDVAEGRSSAWLF